MTNLKKLRIEEGMTQKMLADQSGIGIRMIQACEQGWRTLNYANVKTILSLALALKCELNDLIDDPETKELYKKYRERL